MQLFLQREEPEEEAILQLPHEEGLNSWLKRLRVLGVPQSALKLDRLKDLNNFEDKPDGVHLVAEGKEPEDEGVFVTVHFKWMNPAAQDGSGKADYFSLGFGVDVVEGSATG